MTRSLLRDKAKRSVCLFFAAILILVTTISTGNAFADASSDPLKTARQKIYYHALKMCILDGDTFDYINMGAINGTIANASVSSGNFFYTGWFNNPLGYLHSKDVGAIVEKEVAGEYDNGNIYCSEGNNAIVSKALSAFGMDLKDLVCDYRDNRNSGMFVPEHSTVNCNDAFASGSEAFKLTSNRGTYLKEVVEAKTGLTDLDNLSELEAYYVYKDTFLTACATPHSTIDFDTVGHSYAYTVMGFDKTDGQFKLGGFSGNAASNNIHVWGGIDHDCGYIAGKLQSGNFFDAFKSYFDQEYNNGNGRTPEDIGAITSSTIAGDGGDDKCYDGAGTLGWVLCPVVSAASDLLNRTYKTIEEDYLQIDAVNVFNRRNDGTLTTDPANANDPDNESTLHHIWGIFRDISNIAFVIIFLIIILSQVTGWGIDNYGIKKMLPRLIVMAILVNLSYIVCEIAVDLSNIIGIGIKGFFDNLSIQVQVGGAVVGTDPDNVQNAVVLGGSIAISFVCLLAFPGLILTLVAFLISMVFSVLFLWVVLICRQAGIILGVAVAPLAFICYILPNTERVYKRWFDLMKGLLFLYPICSFVIGGGLLAGKIFASMNSDGTSPGLTLASMIVPVIPYLFIPSLMRNSLRAMGNLGARLQTIGNRWGRGLGSSASRAIGNSAGFKQRQERLNRNRTLRRARRIERRGGASTLTGAAMMRLRGGPTNAQRERLAAAMKANTDEEKRLRDIGNWSDATYVDRMRNKNAAADQIAQEDVLSYDAAMARSEVNKARIERDKRRDDTLMYDPTHANATQIRQNELRMADTARTNKLNDVLAYNAQMGRSELNKAAIDRQKRIDDTTVYDPISVDATRIRDNELRKATTERTNRLRDTLDYDQPMADAEVSQADMNRRIRRADTLQYNDADYVAHTETQAESARIAKQQRLDNYFDPNFAAGERRKSASAAHAELVENQAWDDDRERAENYAADEAATTRRENALLNNDSIFRARQRRMNETQTEKKRIETEAWTAERASGEVAKAKEEAYRAKVSANNYNDADYVKGVRNETKTMNQHQLEQTQNWAATDFNKSKAAQLQNARNAEIRKMYNEQFSSMDKVRLGNTSSGELIKALRATNTGDPQRATERIDAALSSLVNLGAEEEILESLRAFSTSDLRSMNANARTRLLQKAAASQSIALKGWGKAQLSAIQSNPSGATTVDFATYMAAPSTSGSNGSLSDFLRTNGNHALDGASKDLRKVISTYAPNAVSLDTLVNSSVSTKNGEELQYTNDTIRKRIVSASDGQKLAGIYTGQSLGNMDISTFKTIEARANALGVDVKTWFAPAIASLSGNQEGVAKVNNEIRKALGL